METKKRKSPNAAELKDNLYFAYDQIDSFVKITGIKPSTRNNLQNLLRKRFKEVDRPYPELVRTAEINEYFSMGRNEWVNKMFVERYNSRKHHRKNLKKQPELFNNEQSDARERIMQIIHKMSDEEILRIRDLLIGIADFITKLS